MKAVSPCGLLLGDELDAFILSSSTDLLLLGDDLEAGSIDASSPLLPVTSCPEKESAKTRALLAPSVVPTRRPSALARSREKLAKENDELRAEVERLKQAVAARQASQHQASTSGVQWEPTEEWSPSQGWLAYCPHKTLVLRLNAYGRGLVKLTPAQIATLTSGHWHTLLVGMLSHIAPLLATANEHPDSRAATLVAELAEEACALAVSISLLNRPLLAAIARADVVASRLPQTHLSVAQQLAAGPGFKPICQANIVGVLQLTRAKQGRLELERAQVLHLLQALAQQDEGQPCSQTIPGVTLLTQRLQELTEEMHIVGCYQKSAAYNAYQLRYALPHVAVCSIMASGVARGIPNLYALGEAFSAVVPSQALDALDPVLERQFADYRLWYIGLQQKLAAGPAYANS